MKIRSHFLISILAHMLTFVSRVLFWTCRKRIIEKHPGVSPYALSQEKYIYCNWHDGILGAIFCGRVQTMAALTSRHADGEYVADVMHAVGIQPIRGSSNHGGAAAVKQMMQVAERLHITIATDGPRGPRREVKNGIIYLASVTGKRIIPVAFAAPRAWRPRGRWTDLVIPVPFSTIFIIGGSPYSVPPNLSREQLAPFRDELQRRMDELSEEADQLAGVATPKTLPFQRRKAA